MEIILETIRSDLPLIFYVILRAFVIFIMTLGVVYIFGRMLNIINSDRGRNGLAIITSLVLSYFSIMVYDTEILINDYELYWRTFLYSSSSIILYVLIGWRLFDRVDNLLDNKFAPDKGWPPEDETKTDNKRSNKKRK